MVLPDPVATLRSDMSIFDPAVTFTAAVNSATASVTIQDLLDAIKKLPKYEGPTKYIQHGDKIYGFRDPEPPSFLIPHTPFVTEGAMDTLRVRHAISIPVIPLREAPFRQLMPEERSEIERKVAEWKREFDAEDQRKAAEQAKAQRIAARKSAKDKGRTRRQVDI